MSPNNGEELKSLLGEEFQTKDQRELNWLLASIREKIEKQGEDWVKKNRIALLRQWEYVRALL